MADKQKKEIRVLAPVTISIQENELIKTELKSKYPKWKIKLCKWLEINVADDYSYCYRIRYTSNTTKLHPNDVILNSEGRAFVVLKEISCIAIVVTPVASTKPPFVHGTFRVLERPKTKNKN